MIICLSFSLTSITDTQRVTQWLSAEALNWSTEATLQGARHKHFLQDKYYIIRDAK